ncbi:MAG TPA: CheR family methyltransferase, partial [Stellaceae bacterium]|nr:CheR family methyltransferase [Stellaceae bacterium]
MPDNEPAQAAPEPPPEERAAGCPVVGIGASAGGVEALQRFLPAVPGDSGLGYVIVLHLAPEAESFLASILGRAGRIEVVQIADGMAVQPGHAYVIPPNKLVTIQNHVLRLADPPNPSASHNAIDEFLLSLAKDQGENAACAILSGTGSDGTIGLRAIKEEGGLTIAQAHAEYQGMMQSAVATGLVDHVLPIDQIPAALANHFRHRAEVVAKKGPDGALREATDHLTQICSILRTRTGHDFSGYKETTVVRRVQRRMRVLLIDEVPEFIERLRRDPIEVELLFQDLLIGVTSFFRDPDSFQALEKDVIPQLFEGKSADDTVRVWVPGCSTGEEAYSLAILLREYQARSHSPPALQVFASDINEQALDFARTGRYPASIARDVSAQRLAHFFQREDGTYRISSDIRGACLFAQHDLLRDAPFSKLDLVSCRNLMIYLNPELQSRIVPLFHYALREGGYLFLGSSENVTRHPRLFAPADRSHHIYRRLPPAERKVPEFPLVTSNVGHRAPSPAARPPSTELTLSALAERQLLDRYSPAYVIINPDGDVLYTSARTGKYLELPTGAPDTNIFVLARPGLRLDLRAAIHRAATRGEAVVQRNVSVGTNGGRLTVDLFVQPLRPAGGHDGPLMVIFQDLGVVERETDAASAGRREEAHTAGIDQLEMELRITKERLQTTTEELESSNEELKSRNEELSSMNEELQSTNEELETSKEELQSINEELQTVNAELKARVDELSRANSDIANLLESTQIATLFLDRDLAITSFTPAAKELFHLVESDAGRPIAHVRPRFSDDTVEADAERVLRTLATVERQVESGE